MNSTEECKLQFLKIPQLKIWFLSDIKCSVMAAVLGKICRFYAILCNGNPASAQSPLNTLWWLFLSSSMLIELTLKSTCTTKNFLSALEVTYTQVWYIVGIISSSPTHFHSEKIGLIRVTIDPLSALGLIWHSEGTYSEVWYIIENVC